MSAGTSVGSLIASRVVAALPDLEQVVRLVTHMKAEHRERWEQDTSKTSLPLLLGVLARHQARVEGERGETGEVVEEEVGRQVEAVCRRYWHLLHTLGVGIRRGVTSSTADTLATVLEANRVAVAEELGVGEEDLMVVWVSECAGEGGEHLGNHCPDLALSIDREQQALVLTLLGTRITPAPNIQDIVMDLRADSQPFLGGEAHSGMATGAENILEKVLGRVVGELEADPSLSLLVVGYSLGAGLAQLVVASLAAGALLPPGTALRCLAFGAPPVYRGAAGACSEVTVVQHASDGILCASVGTLADLLDRLVAIDAADIGHSTMLAMVAGLDKEEEDEADGDNPEDEDTTEEAETQVESRFGFRGFLRSQLKARLGSRLGAVAEDDWARVGEALEGLPVQEGRDWRLLAGTVLNMRVEGEGVSTRAHRGAEATSQLTKEMRLHSSMYGDHMPGGYTALFQVTVPLNINICSRLLPANLPPFPAWTTSDMVLVSPIGSAANQVLSKRM